MSMKIKGRGGREFYARRVGVHAEIDKVKYPVSGWKFRACMWIPGQPRYKRVSYKIMRSVGCGVGSNPRKALAGAARAFAARMLGAKSEGPGGMTGRRGVFKGLAGYSKSHRKARRTARAGKRSR